MADPTQTGSLTVSAWSNTKNSSTAADAYIQNAYLASYSGGLGVTNRDGASGGGDTYEGTIAQTSVPAGIRSVQTCRKRPSGRSSISVLCARYSALSGQR